MRVRAVARHYLLPGTKGRFIIACDPSEGVEGGNPCAAVVLRAENWEVCAVLSGLLPPHRLAVALTTLSNAYAKGDLSGKPVVVIENNSFGIAVLTELRSSKLNIYGTYIASRNDFKLGYPTHMRSREQAFEEMRMVQEKWGILVHDRALYEQIRHGNLVYDENGKVGCADGPDDLAMALSIACFVRREKYGPNPMPVPEGDVPAPRKKEKHDWVWEDVARREKELREGVEVDSEEYDFV